jgi:Mlc titration factor MtfA (ptsG expression regulator)
MLGIFKNARRRRILARHTIPVTLWLATLDDIACLSRLGDDERRRLHDLTLLFLHEKSIEPAGDLVLDDAMRVRIAALACQPVLELGLDSYSGFVSIIVYPGEFLVRGREYEDEDGVVHTGDDVLSGEAWEQGPVILAWQDVLASGRGTGFDVVAHEFAHKLDLLDGAINGVPPLHREMSYDHWIETFQTAYDELCESLDRGDDTWLDPYAAEDAGEFFAVCTEMFFDVPDELHAHYPAVYTELAAFFRQDPGGRLVRGQFT